MDNVALLILYNPYYQDDVIESHLEVLKKHGKVAFGKIKSKMRGICSSREQAYPQSENALNTHEYLSLQSLINKVSAHNPLQLFLSDYASLYVCKVVGITQTPCAIPPSYYKQKQLEVELWFIISDMRELVRDDFKHVRDMFLSNFITLHNNRTFALYGNDYVYPLFISMKKKIDYFATLHASQKPIIHYHDIFKTDAQIQMRHNLIDYIFGDTLIYDLHPDSVENLVNAEIEYQTNKENPLYDCTGIIMLYSKTMEQEIQRFCVLFFRTLIDFEKNAKADSFVARLTYSVQGVDSNLWDWLDNKATINPNMGTLVFLMREAKEVIQSWRCAKHKKISDSMMNRHDIGQFILRLSQFIKILQSIRNPTAHATKPKIKDAALLRKQILGIGHESMLNSLLLGMKALQS